ncbi:MAG: DUF3656 domain-containing protein [Hominilimicola sp.]
MELLAPAGSSAALCAAVQSGADAVYLGGSMFGARQSAENFAPDDMKKWVDYCHLYGVDVHVTVNTLIKEKEMASFQEYIKELNGIGIDALIVQDIGAAEIIKNTIPDMTLHASTQMTVTSLEGVKYLENMGFSRVVLSRELSEKEIEHICKNAKAEIEVFVHGAICMCYSGQCLMSSILGGRSGNRGRCAQPCRLPYELLEKGKTAGSGYVLSPKDMALINELGTLNEIGVASLKIEGRLKRAEYVSAVVGVYRKYLDMFKTGKAQVVSKRDIQELLDAFSRTGFTDGYFKGNLGKNMMSHDTPGNSSENKFTDEARKRAAENANIRKIPISIMGTLKNNSPLELTFYDSDGNYAYTSGTLKSEAARQKAMDEKRLQTQLLKLGNTPFECEEISLSVDEEITLPVKEINSVRRDAADKLMIERQQREKGKVTDYALPKYKRGKCGDIMLTAEVLSEEQLKAAIEKNVQRIYVPSALMGTLNKETQKHNKLIDIAAQKGIEIITKASEIFCEEKITTDGVLVSSPAAAYKYNDKKLYGDFRLNVYNSFAAQHFDFLETVTLSPELNLHEIGELLENTSANTEIIAYGHIPLMIMKNCPIKAMGKCQNGKNIYKLRDRKKEEFPIVCNGDCHGCRAKLLNSKPIFMADKMADLKNLKINSIRLIFTVENFSQCGKIIDVYKNALRGEVIENDMADNSYTRGHFYRGVL